MTTQAIVGAVLLVWLIAALALIWIGHRLELHTHARDYRARDREAGGLRDINQGVRIHTGAITDVVR